MVSNIRKILGLLTHNQVRSSPIAPCHFVNNFIEQAQVTRRYLEAAMKQRG